MAANDDLPNPYPVPGKPYKLSIDDYHEMVLPDHDTTACIFEGFRQLHRHIRDHGNGLIPLDPGRIRVRYGTVEFTMYRIVVVADPRPEDQLRYDDAILVLGTLSMWVGRYGHRGWYAYVYFEDRGVKPGFASLMADV